MSWIANSINDPKYLLSNSKTPAIRFIVNFCLWTSDFLVQISFCSSNILEIRRILSWISGTEHSQINYKKVNTEQGITEYNKYAEFNHAVKYVALTKTANRGYMKFYPKNRI